MTKIVKSNKYQAELTIARKEILRQEKKYEKLKAELVIAHNRLASEKEEKGKRSVALGIANKEKGKRAAELGIANIEKSKRADELSIANKELVFQDEEKEKRADELILANKELGFQNEEKVKRAAELVKLSSVYKMLYNTVADVIYVIDREAGRYRFTSVNKAFELVTGIPLDKVIGKYVDEIIPQPGLKIALNRYEEAVRQKKMIKWEETSDYPNGRLTGAVSVLPVFDEKGNCISLIGNVHDITDRKRIEEEIKKINEGLDQKVNERTSQIKLINKNLEKAKIKAEKATCIAEDAVRSKQQFLSNMSHEIRTPMNAIIGFTKVVLKTDLTAKQKEYLTAIKVSGDALIVLINDILDLAKVDAGKMTFEQKPFRMLTSISAMLHLFETKIQEKNLKLIKKYDKKIPEILVGDQIRLHQIILNLVSNAVKFTSAGNIVMSVRLVSEDKEKVKIEFTVSDTGIGISENNLNRIFETFGQASSETSRLYGGTGLGLAIVKQLVESQGGMIQVKSILGNGSAFSFTLNFRKSQAGDEIAEESFETVLKIKSIKILVVEDMALNQLLMKTLLDDFGFENDVAANGKMAIKMLKKKFYDIILMDLQMPEMNGFEATRYIRKKMHSKIPIIALTADVTTVDLEKCKKEGMNDYLAKPVDEKILLNKILGLTQTNKGLNYIEGQNHREKSNETINKKCVNLNYLYELTKSNPNLISKMILIYLEETPILIDEMKQNLSKQKWNLLLAAVHKIIPTFRVMGIDKSYKDMATRINECIRSKQYDEIEGLVLKIETVCAQACKELMSESVKIKSKVRIKK